MQSFTRYFWATKEILKISHNFEFELMKFKFMPCVCLMLRGGIKHFSIMWILPEHSFKRVQTIFIAHVVDSTLKNFLSTPKFKFEHEIKFSIWNCWCLHIHSFIQSCSSVYRSIYRLIWIHLNFLLESTYLLCADDVLLVTRHKNHNSVISKQGGRWSCGKSFHASKIHLLPLYRHQEISQDFLAMCTWLCVWWAINFIRNKKVSGKWCVKNIFFFVKFHCHKLHLLSGKWASFLMTIASS